MMISGLGTSIVLLYDERVVNKYYKGQVFLQIFILVDYNSTFQPLL
jgi:hypothetical protein